MKRKGKNEKKKNHKKEVGSEFRCLNSKPWNKYHTVWHTHAAHVEIKMPVLPLLTQM